MYKRRWRKYEKRPVIGGLCKKGSNEMDESQLVREHTMDSVLVRKEKKREQETVLSRPGNLLGIVLPIMVKWSLRLFSY